MAIATLLPLYVHLALQAQASVPIQDQTQAAPPSPQPAPPSASTDASRAAEIRELRLELDTLSKRLAALEAPATPTPASTPTTTIAVTPAPAAPLPPVLVPEDAPNLGFLRGTTLSFGVDGYYGYNANAPIGRVNLLRAYDVSSNSFSINQASLIVEHLPTPTSRVGGRIDLQFGQATETLQGSSANEQRPQVWRNLFQAYGSYLAPVGSGLQLDFGKFSSSLGNEGNYTKDQITYSRAFSFNYLPFYHTGLRATYNITPKVNFTYWLVNGAQQTEDFNGFKSQGFIFTLKPASTVSWNVNYYFGQEARDVLPTLNPGIPTAPTQPGLPTTNINPAPNGREHIFDTYATWTPKGKFTLVGEADYVLNRTYSHDQPGRVAIGSLTARYALRPNTNLGGPLRILRRSRRPLQRHHPGTQRVHSRRRPHLRSERRLRLSCPRRVPPRLLESTLLPHRYQRPACPRADNRRARPRLLVGHQKPVAGNSARKAIPMLDILAIVSTVLLFGLAAYVHPRLRIASN